MYIIKSIHTLCTIQRIMQQFIYNKTNYMSCNTRSVQVSQLAVNHATTCSCKLSSISLQVTLSVNTINTRQNRIKVGNPRHLTAGTSYIAGHQGKLGQIEDI